MRRIFLYLVMITPLIGVAQIPMDLLLLHESPDSLGRLGVSLEAGSSWYSNALHNEMASKLYFGGFIDETMKSEAFDDLEQRNVAYGDAFFKLNVYNLADTIFPANNWGLKLNLEWRVDISSDFTEDLFRIGFSGNRNYAGQNADFSGSGFRYMEYQKFGIGFFHKETFSGLNLSFVNGDELFQSDLENAGLFTAANGDSLVLDYNGSLWQSDSSRTGLLNGNGAGMALDLYWNLPFADDKGFVRVAAEDLGFIRWSEETQTSSADSSYVFSGVDIQEALEINDPLDFGSIEDTLGLSTKNAGHTTWLPAQVHLGVIRSFKPKWYYSVDIKTRVVDKLFPQLIGGVIYSPNQDFLTGMQLGISAFGNPQLNWRGEWRTLRTWYLRWSLSQFQSLIMKNTRGGGLTFAVLKVF